MVTIFYKPELTSDDMHSLRVAVAIVADNYRKIIAEANQNGVYDDTAKSLEERISEYEAAAHKLCGVAVDRIEE